MIPDIHLICKVVTKNDVAVLFYQLIQLVSNIDVLLPWRSIMHGK